MTEKSNRICVLRHGYFHLDARLRKQVTSLLDTGFQVDIICLRMPGEKVREDHGNLRIYRLPFSHQRNSIPSYVLRYLLSFILMALMVTVLFIRRRYALIQVNTMPDFLVFATFIPKFLGASILLDLLEPTPELWLSIYEDKNISFLIKLFTAIEQAAIRYSDCVMTVNETIRRRFIERGADKNKIFVVRNVPTDLFKINGAHKLPENRFKLMTHGSIEKRYGHEVILKALPELRKKIPNIHLYILGIGDFADHLRELTRRLNITDIVTFTGWVPFSDIPGMLHCADLGIVAILPTPFGRLCQPNKLFEYVEMVRPVIAPRLEAIEEVFDDSCVFYFEPGNETDLAERVLEFHSNPDSGRKRAGNAWEAYRVMKWSVAKTHYLGILGRTINSRREAPEGIRRPRIPVCPTILPDTGIPLPIDHTAAKP